MDSIVPDTAPPAVGREPPGRRDVLDDAPLRLEMPPWAHAVGAASVWLTAVIAAFVYLGTVPAALLAIAGAVAGPAWLHTTYRCPASRRTVSIYVGAVVALLVHAGEQHVNGYTDVVAAMHPGAAMRADQLTYTLAMALVPTAVYLLGAVGLLVHHGLGNALAWWIVVWSIVWPVSHIVLPLWAVDGYAYVPGMATGALPLAVGAIGARRLLTERVERGDPT